MPELPKVAIVTRTRDRNGLLRRAIESVLAQSMPDWQHIIVNDGGDRESLEALCETFKEAYAGRLKLLHLDHAGMQVASNEAIQASQSTYITIHDDDDAWHPDFLKETTAELDKLGPESKYQGAISKTARILEKEQKDGSFREIERSPYVPLREISLFRIGYENPFPPIAFIYRRRVHEELGFFDPKWDVVADLDFNFRFLQRHEIRVVDKILAYYHWRADSKPSPNANSVTVSSDKHGRLLNELKNHYLRQVDSVEGAARGLAFLISSFAVENQWMTDEVKERSANIQLQVAKLAELIHQLQTFNDTAVWPKLEATMEWLSQLQAFNDQALWPKLETLVEFLNENEKAVWTKLEAHTELLNEVRAFNDKALWPKLEVLLELINGVRHFNDKNLWPLLETLVKKSDTSMDGVLALKAAFDKNIPESVATQTALKDGVEELKEKLWSLEKVGNSRAATEKAALEAIQKENQSLAATAHETASQLSALAEEVGILRKSSKRQWQFGPLRIQWKPGQKKEAQENPET